MQGTSAPQACWTVIGVGIRLAQDVGAHRRKVYNTISTVDEELWKRAFWYDFCSWLRFLTDLAALWFRVLVSMDRVMSMMLGRPCAIQDEESVFNNPPYLTALLTTIVRLALTSSFLLNAMTSTGLLKIILSRSNNLLDNRPR